MSKVDFEFLNKKQSNRFIAKRRFSIKKSPTWLLPLVFLLGYLFAWGTITVDRQMLIEEQRQLQDEIDDVRIERKVMRMIDEYNEDYVDLVEWNKEAIEEPEEKGK